MLGRHSSDNDDSHEPPRDDKEESRLIEPREEAVSEDDDGAAEPGDEDEGDVDVPGLDFKLGVEDGVHLDYNVGGDRDYGGEVEDPAEEVEGAGVEAYDPAVAGAGGYGGPVVDAAGGGDAGC